MVGLEEGKEKSKMSHQLRENWHKLMPLKSFLGLYIENIEINTKQVSEYSQKAKI